MVRKSKEVGGVNVAAVMKVANPLVDCSADCWVGGERIGSAEGQSSRDVGAEVDDKDSSHPAN